MAREEQSDRWSKPVVLSALVQPQIIRHRVEACPLMISPNDRTLSPIRWQKFVGPHLPMRMRIAAPHHRPAILEDLQPIDPRLTSKFRELVRTRCPPRVAVPLLPFAQGSGRDGVKTNYTTSACFAAGNQSPFPQLPSLDFGLQRSKVIIKNKSAGIRRILLAAARTLPGQEITCGIKGHWGKGWNVSSWPSQGRWVRSGATSTHSE